MRAAEIQPAPVWSKVHTNKEVVTELLSHLLPSEHGLSHFLFQASVLQPQGLMLGVFFSLNNVESRDLPESHNKPQWLKPV